MSNTVITNYTDLNGPSTKADSSVVVIVNKDGSLSVDQNLLGTLMGSDGSQSAGISVVRVGHEGKPDDATDSETEDDNVPHVTLSVDSYYNEPNSIIKYDSGAEMLQSLKIETRENSLVGFQNDHCYTPLTSPGQNLPQKSDTYSGFDDPVIEITHTPPPKPPVSNSKKITILEQQIIPKGKKIVLNTSEAPIILKGNDVLNKPLSKTKRAHELSKKYSKNEESNESSSVSSSGDSIPDRDSDSDYKDTKDRSDSIKTRKSKLKPRILKNVRSTKTAKLDIKIPPKLKLSKAIAKRELKERVSQKITHLEKKQLPSTTISKDSVIEASPEIEPAKVPAKQSLKQFRKEKKTPAHVTALLTDMTTLFSTPDVIRRVSTDNKVPKNDKEQLGNRKVNDDCRTLQPNNETLKDNSKALENLEKSKSVSNIKSFLKQKDKNPDKISKGYDIMPQLDDASLAQILQDATGVTSKNQSSISAAHALNSPGLAGPLSPTLDLLGGLQPEEDGLTEDLLMHVAQLVESSENLQEVIDKQVLGKVDSLSIKTSTALHYQQPQTINTYGQTPKSIKTITPRKDPIEIIRRDGRIITLPPIEAPATRASKRKNQVETSSAVEELAPPTTSVAQSVTTTPEPQVQQVSKQYVNKKLTSKKTEKLNEALALDKLLAESQESWNSEDDPNRLWCICKQPHNNRFMICCDGCEDWFHGKCVNITKIMGQQMEEQGIEWRCPNCVKKVNTTPKHDSKAVMAHNKLEIEEKINPLQVVTPKATKTGCIVCKKPARASSIYCSDACILKHAQDSLVTQGSSNKSENEGRHEKQKSESRVIVYERKTGKLLAGPNAPTAENLKVWLQKNPTFEVVRPGTLSTIKPNAMAKRNLNEPNKIQTTLNFERIPRKLAAQGQLSPTKSAPPDVKEATRISAQSRDVKSNSQTKTPITPNPHDKTLVASTTQSKTVVIPNTPTTPSANQKSLLTTNSQPKTGTTNSQLKPLSSLSSEKTVATSNYQSKTTVTPNSQTKPIATPNSELKGSATPRLQSRMSGTSNLLSKTTNPPLKSPTTPNPPAKLSIPQPQTKTPVNIHSQPKTPTSNKSQPSQFMDTPKASTSKPASEPRRLSRSTASRSQSEKASVSPATPRRNIESKNKMNSTDPVRENVRKALQEQITIRMGENTEKTPKFAEEEILQFANDTELELHELFKDVGMKYKAKYRSLMFNIKDRKNLSLWQKICEKIITPKQLVRLSPEELASQELAEWRDNEAKYQLELIKKSEIDLLAASKTYVLKTHKGEEVMETKTSVSTEVDPNVAVEDLVTVLNDAAGVEDVPTKSPPEAPSTTTKIEPDRRSKNSTRKDKDEPETKKRKSTRESKRESESRKSRSSRRSEGKEREERSTRRSERKSVRARSASKDRSKNKPDSSEQSRRRSRSRAKSRRRSKSRERSRSASKGRERSKSRARSKRRSRSKETTGMRLRHRSRSKHRISTEEKKKHRSKSQEHSSTKGKNDSTDSDSIERPKSAMLKEAHPEYDPHEPMITSAFSEEDLRKSRDDVYEDSYKADITGFGDSKFDTSEEYPIDTSLLPTLKYPEQPDKIWDVESDQEPSSTVDNSAPVVWNGCINMVDVARFYVAAHEVSGTAGDLEEDLSAELDIVGRINPDTVWDYIHKMKKAGNKDIFILRLQAANDEEKMQYIALYSYLSSRNRLGVVQVSNTSTLKDFYIVPLPANTTLPPILQTFDGPGLGEVKTHLLIGIVIRQRKKRLAPHIPKDIIPAKMGRLAGSYTPPVIGSATPPATTTTSYPPVTTGTSYPPVTTGTSSYTPPTSPRPRAPPTPHYTSPALSSSVKDKIAASLAAADDEEAYSPGSSSSGNSLPAPANALRSKMDELNRQIEEQKQQILKMARADSSVADEEAYSPSRPMTPPETTTASLADIALPSNLQEILATIKQREIAPESTP